MKVGEWIAVRTWRWSSLIAIVILPTVARTNLSVRLSPLDLMFILDFSGPSLTFIYDYSRHCARLGRVRFYVPGWAGALAASPALQPIRLFSKIQETCCKGREEIRH